ncbi:MAG: S8 family serine peptidase [Deltaproteobacteria bacterium]|nr:S8 family serine peptidase [Deltaproteobacteria bacterium]MBW2413568.1 S8 family serine peptidase [Deltaproteobacteria bacterium]
MRALRTACVRFLTPLLFLSPVWWSSGCAVLGTAPPPEPLPELWTAPQKPDDAERLTLEPRVGVARIGEPVTLVLHGRDAGGAECSLPRQGFSLRVESPASPGVVEVQCTSAHLAAFAQVTFTDAATLPVADPYSGGVVLFKLREAPAFALDAVGRRDLGFAGLEDKLHAFGAWAMAAFPLNLQGHVDEAGLARWVAIDLPKRTNFYQAVSLLRADPAIEPSSYLPQEAPFVRVGVRKTWPARLVAATREDESFRGPRRPDATPVSVTDHPLNRAKPSRAVRAVGAPEAWKDGVRGRGIGIAIVDTGVDRRQRALSSNIRAKDEESPVENADGNGIPGDAQGANFAHLAIAHSYGPPRLGLGLHGDVSDWSGAAEGRPPETWGHGTWIAALAAGFDPRSGAAGVAPQAWLLPVDVQENLRPPGRTAPADDDPRMRDLPRRASARRSLEPLREPLWARALGTAYAATEGARVITCAWPAQQPHALLYDALRFAEDNCAIPVCGVEESADGIPARGSYPAGWRNGRARLDVWTGEIQPDRLDRRLDGLMIAGEVPDGPVPDLRAPRGAARSARLPASWPDRTRSHAREAEFSGPGLAVGLVAGTAALALEDRPDLPPDRLRELMIVGAGPNATVSVPGTLDAVEGQIVGGCGAAQRPGYQAGSDGKPWWSRTRVSGSSQSAGGKKVSFPAEPDPANPSDPDED